MSLFGLRWAMSPPVPLWAALARFGLPPSGVKRCVLLGQLVLFVVEAGEHSHGFTTAGDEQLPLCMVVDMRFAQERDGTFPGPLGESMFATVTGDGATFEQDF